MSDTRKASCSCGQLSVETSGEPVRVSVCHCYECQKRTGSTYGAQARYPKESVRITGEGREFVRVADSGNKASFFFCPTCGSTVYYLIHDQPEIMAVPIGGFADSSFMAPSFSVYEERMHSWVVMPEDMEHWD